MDDYLGIWILIAGVFCVAILFLCRYLVRNVWNPQGKGAARKTTRLLKKQTYLRKCKLVSDVTLAYNDNTAYIENMLIGPFGILLVQTCGARGEYYGTLDSEKWIITLDQSRREIPNPVMAMKNTTALMREIFAKHQLYKIQIESIVNMTSKASKTALYVTNNGEIMPMAKLKGYLGRSKFDKDFGLDLQRIQDTLMQYAK